MTNTMAFQHQCVRDLAWAMGSPPLLSQAQSPYCGDSVTDVWCQRIVHENKQWLSELDEDPEPLLCWLAQHETPRLGIYFESLLAFWLTHLSDVELLVQNLIVDQSGLQLGEFDVLFRDLVGNQIVHWEITVKFYLRFGVKNYQWPGPNPCDTLQHKLNKVFERQLLLSQQPQAQQILQTMFGTTNISPQAFIKGYLFYPYANDWKNPIEIPAGVSNNHLKGWWCHHVDMSGVVAEQPSEHRWRILPHKEWLAPLLMCSTDGLLDAHELTGYLAEYFARQFQALLLVELKWSDVGWCEVSRGFVVNDAWPNDAGVNS